MTTAISELLKELQDQKALLTTQKEILELKTQIAALTKAVETPPTPAAGGESEEKDAEAEAGAEEGSAGAASYLAEITAYEMLQAIAKKVGQQVSDLKDVKKVLVLGDQCLAERCLPLSDVALHQTTMQIEIVKGQVDQRIKDLKDFPRPAPRERVAAREKGEKEPLYDVIASLLTGWGGPVAAAGELVKSAGDLLSQFAASFAFQEREVILALEALVNATVGAMPDGKAQVLSMGRIGATPVDPNSILGKLEGLIEAIQKLEEERIRLTAEVVTPLTLETLRRANSIAKLETRKAALDTELAAINKRIGELKVKRQQETDPVKKAELQKEIDLEAPGLQDLQHQLTKVADSIAQEQQELEVMNLQLTKANAEVEIAADLVKTFTAFYQGITTAPDKTTLSTLARAVLREYSLQFSHLLRLSIHSGGAEVITRKQFGFESRRFVGGCAVSYTIVDTRNDKVVRSGLEVAAGWRKFSFSDAAKMALETIPPYKYPSSTP